MLQYEVVHSGRTGSWQPARRQVNRAPRELEDVIGIVVTVVGLPTGGSWESRGGGGGSQLMVRKWRTAMLRVSATGSINPQEAPPMLAHGVAFCDDERGGVGTWGGEVHPARRQDTIGGNLPLAGALGEGGGGGEGALAEVACGRSCVERRRASSCRRPWTSLVRFLMDTWFASQTAINPVSKEWTGVNVGGWRGWWPRWRWRGTKHRHWIGSHWQRPS